MTLPNDAQTDANVDATTRGMLTPLTIAVPFSARVSARLFAARYDHQVEDGVGVGAGTALAAHHARLTSGHERDEMARALTLLMRDAGLDTADHCRSVRAAPIQADAVRGSADVVADVLARLTDPLPVRARGMARLRMLLGDGRSPVYRSQRGTFAAAMRGVLAAL